MGLFNKAQQAPKGALRLNGYLQELYDGVFHFDDENFWMGVEGSTILTILYLQHSDDLGTVHINAHVVREVEATPALCHDLLTNPDYKFNVGRWEIEPDVNNPDRVAVLLGVDLVDFESSLGPGELSMVIGTLAEMADKFDDELAARHGGLTAVKAIEKNQ